MYFKVICLQIKLKNLLRIYEELGEVNNMILNSNLFMIF